MKEIVVKESAARLGHREVSKAIQEAKSSKVSNGIASNGIRFNLIRNILVIL